jgi:hypothetical protein
MFACTLAHVCLVLAQTDSFADVNIEGVYNGSPATAEVLLDYRVASIEVLKHGFGYGRTQSLVAVVEPPPRLPPSCLPPTQDAALLIPAPRTAVGKLVLDTSRVPATEAERRGSFWVTGPELRATYSALLPSSTIPQYDPSSGTYNISGLEYREGSSTDPLFGGLASRGVARDLKLKYEDYVKFAAAGAVCTAMIRYALSPLELVKTQLQVCQPGRFASPAGGTEEPSWKRCAKVIMQSADIIEKNRSSTPAPCGPSAEASPPSSLAVSPGVKMLFRGADASLVVGLLLGGASFVQVGRLGQRNACSS